MTRSKSEELLVEPDLMMAPTGRLGGVDLAVVVEVDSLKDLIDFFLAHVKLVEGLSDFTEL